MFIEGRLDSLDTLGIVFHLTTIGAAQADDPSHFAAVYKGHVVEDLRLRCERDHSRLSVVEPVVAPYQRGFPVELGGQTQRDAMLRLVHQIFGWIELDPHVYCSYGK